MNSRSATCLLLLIGCLLATAFSRSVYAQQFHPFGSAFVKNHCLKCHSGKEPKAELSFESLRDNLSLVKERKVWVAALNRIATSEMPPKGHRKPSVAEAVAFTDLVNAIFDEHDRNAKPDPGRVTMRRLNRLEYRNTIRDLVGVEFDPTADFPSDDIGHGFDNIGDVLSVSPFLMERYLAAAEQVMSRAIMSTPPPVVKRHLNSVFTEPASSNSGKLVVKGFRPMRTNGKQFIELGPINTPYKWEAEGEYIFRTRVYAETADAKPLKVTILLHGKDLPDPSPASAIEPLLGNPKQPARILKTFMVKAATRDKAEVLEIRIPAMPGRERMQIAIDKVPEAGRQATLWVDYLALEGPLDPRPASHRELLDTTETEPAAKTRDVLSRFLRRAFRRSPTPDEVTRSIAMADAATADGANWEASIQYAMTAALCSPKFLFRVESDIDPESAGTESLDQFQLASRLSYFLWSSMPDETLLKLAEEKQLAHQLEAQTKRLLADPRSSALVTSFALQWLQLKRLDFISPDGKRFPTFNVKLRQSMVGETELFLDSVVKEDRSILDLIDADYTFLNQPLAKHYGIADTRGNLVGEKPTEKGQPIRGDAFVRVHLQNRNRGGLLTHASVLTATSNPTRTSPVKRGRWVLEQIMGTPPPPPPADVPELSEAEQDITAASLRERMEVHRRDPACANCHAKMDPIGFALENFNAVGAWRTEDGAFEIDASGEFTDGTKFVGPAELKSFIISHKEEFVTCLVEKMLTYAIGRGLEYYDRPTVDSIVKAIAKKEYRFSALIAEIVQCDAFVQRRGS